MSSSTAQPKAEFVPSGFFVLRSPLLSIDELLNWSNGLEASAWLTDSARFEDAVAADRRKLHARLRTAMTRREVREALFVASPHLEESIDIWLRDPESNRGKGLEQAMARYFLRMAGRATPFGLCAGYSLGTIAEGTRLVLEPRSCWKRRTRLDMGYLSALADVLGADPKLRKIFLYCPNSSLYRAAGRLRYAESYMEDKEQKRSHSYRLVAVDGTETLNAVLGCARDGASFAQLSSAIVDHDVSPEEAEEFVAQLIESQILVPDIRLPITGAEATDTLIDQFATHAETVPVADVLMQVSDRFIKLDKAGKLLADLPPKVELSRFVQVELIKPARELKLGRNVLAEISRGVRLLHRLVRSPRPEPDELTRFREAFAARYEQRLVPLTEALDGEIGLGFPVSDNAHDRESPLLRGLYFPPTGRESVPWEERDKLLLRKLNDALLTGEYEIVLDERDVDAIATPDPLPLPDSFSAIAVIEAVSETALANSSFRVLVKGVDGPSGALLLGRFCHADAVLCEEVKSHLRAEETLRPEAIFAEIVHLPEGRLGNVLARPVLRDYEIPYLGCSGVEPDRQIPVTDLYIKMEANALKLYSARLGREVIPRLTSAHNFSWRGIPVYRFLASLQRQNTASLGWSWGALEHAPFLQRITSGKLVLARARWRVDTKELRSLGKEHGAAQFRAFQKWRAARRLLRFVALADGDNELPLDLDNVICVETLIDRIKGRDDATLVELFPASDSLCVRGAEGRYVHELIVPFVRSALVATSNSRIDIGAATKIDKVKRSFPPGSEWIYLKLYTGAATADRILCETVAPLVKRLLGSDAVDRWFFIRHGDPDWHLRLRFHGSPKRLRNLVMPTVESAIAPFLRDGRVRRIQYDTYEREMERYGGPKAMQIAEKMFQIDSEAVLEILAQLEPGDAGAEERWRLALAGSDALLEDFGFDLAMKTDVAKKLGAQFVREFKMDSQLKGQLSERFRNERKRLEDLVQPAGHENDPLAPGLEILREILRRRSARLAPLITKLKALREAGQLTLPLRELAPSYVHVFVNRLLRSGQRAHEAVLYDFLARIYQSALARQA
ncbi:MAG: Lanthionine biosynthesis protein LanB [Acidobacteria bacterium]|nr:MAG: Lanthionine biosynthesis protein LanB [Acidobacteriota bacterium]